MENYFWECGFFVSLRMTLVCHCEPSQKAWRSVLLFVDIITISVGATLAVAHF
ncbi:MAG: hypothetical protein IJE28_09690 [Oscillospiraceae bacterium]|nr:hypothetical protein [Oscillospiraceae bacterium]MBQ3501380.1 hypothetical protein [Oscillospiraceae bacterium]